MKKYVVAVISLFDNELKQYIIEAENEYEALKIGMIKLYTSEDDISDEKEWQSNPDYPSNYEDLLYSLVNCDTVASVIEI